MASRDCGLAFKLTARDGKAKFPPTLSGLDGLVGESFRMAQGVKATAPLARG